jgi:SAM-dependent methyltransferase
LTGRLLDVGCGTKPYAPILSFSEHVGVDVAGSPHALTAADRVYDGRTLPFGDAAFDSLLCTEVLEHCADPDRLAHEIGRVLKPGGHALIAVPMVLQHHEEPHDYQRFTRWGMERLASAAGAEIVWLRARGGVYSTALASVHLAVSTSLSRRPFADVARWALWPIAAAAVALDKRGRQPPAITLGWQMLMRKR